MDKIEYQNNRFNNKQKTVITLFDCNDIVNNAAVLSRFSRTKLGIDSLLETTNGQDFYSRVLEGYGDDSILEMGTIQLVIENISEIALREIISKRIGVSFIQRSTRYQPILEFHTPSEFEEVPDFFDDYIKVMFDLKKQYEFFIKKMENIYSEKLKIDDYKFYDTDKKELVNFSLLKNNEDIKMAEKIYENSIKDKALDIARYLLPSSSYTSVALNINGRALEYLLFSLYESELLENKLLYKNLVTLLKPYLKPFINRVINEPDGSYLKKINNIEESNTQLQEHVIETCVGIANNLKQQLGYDCRPTTDNIIRVDEDLINSSKRKIYVRTPYLTTPVIYSLAPLSSNIRKALVAASIVYNQKYRYYQISLTDESKQSIDIELDTGSYTYESIYHYLSENNKIATDIINSITSNRNSRRDKLPRNFELVDNIFEIQCSFGTFRDIQRHRMATIISEKYITNFNKYLIPKIINDDEKLFNPFVDSLDEVYRLYSRYLNKSKNNFVVAQYCTTFANVVKFILKINDRALSHFCELRSQKQGHEEYRYIAQILGAYVPSPFIDYNNSETLNRYESYIKNLIKTIG